MALPSFEQAQAQLVDSDRILYRLTLTKDRESNHQYQEHQRARAHE
ncbi:MAG: hypothetical protein ACYDA0_15580 [Candidatus Dormibacteraceae bacterium]